MASADQMTQSPSGPAMQAIAGMLLRPIYGGIGCVLRFHRIVARDERAAIGENRSLEITAGSLRSILEWVRAHGLDVLRLDEVRARLASPRKPKFVVFTFDGGYRDTETEALPIFRDFGMPFTMNVVTGFLSGTTSVWWYALEDALGGRPEFAFEWEGRRREYRLQNPVDRERASAEIAALIREQGRASRDELVARVCAAGGIDPLARTRDLMLTWNELKPVVGDWHVHIGSQTAGHHNLRRLTDEEVEDEMIDGRAEIEGRLDLPVQHLAYPFGGRDEAGPREFDSARDVDFMTGTTARSGNLFHQHAWHLQALPRLEIDGNYAPLTRLQQLESGLIPALQNRWRRFVVE